MKRYQKRNSFDIKRKEITQNSFGSEVVYWKKIGIIRGGYVDLIDSEMAQKYGKMVASSTHNLICSIADVRLDDHIVFDGKEYKVNFVYNPMEANRHLEIELELVTTTPTNVKNFIYYGVSVEPSLSTEITAFDSIETDKKVLSQELNPTDEYIYFAYPVVFGDVTVRLNEELDMSFVRNEVVINGVKHYVYRSGSLLDGSYELEIM